MVRRIRKINGDTNSEVLMYLPEMTDHTEIEDAVKKYLGHPNSSFNMGDMYSDVDAVGIYSLVMSKDINIAVKTYYDTNKNEYSGKRYRNFVNGILQHEKGQIYDDDYFIKQLEFKKIVYSYLEKLFYVKEWPLINKHKAEDANISTAVRLGTKNGFVEFIWERME